MQFGSIRFELQLDSDVGGEFLAKGLTYNQRLIKVNLKMNHFKVNSGLYFLEAVKNNKNIEILNLNMNLLAPNHLQDIQKKLSQNAIKGP